MVLQLRTLNTAVRRDRLDKLPTWWCRRMTAPRRMSAVRDADPGWSLTVPS